MNARTRRVIRRRFELLKDGVRIRLGGTHYAIPDTLTGTAHAERTPNLISTDERKTIAERLRADYPEVAEQIVAQAERAVAHEFDLLGSGPCRMNGAIRWHEDFGAGRAWPRRFSALLRVQYRDASDIKRPWELSRCQHVTALGQAYLLTGDEKYPREWVAQMLDWERQNPPLIGPNWIVPMEAAIRIVNWIWGHAFMSHSPAFDDAARSCFARALLGHGRFILRHLEGYGNHRFSNFVGLSFLGLLFPEFAEAAEWRETGLRGFNEEARKQVRGDGAHFEGSIPYHRLVLEMAAAVWLLCRRSGVELPARTTDAIARMFDFTAGCLKPNGCAPQVGDADDGRLHEFTPLDKRDHACLLTLGAALTGRSDFKRTPKPHPETLWLLGSEGLSAYDALPLNEAPQRSRLFRESGFAALRSDRAHAFVSCRRPHRKDVGAHSHNDHLGVTLTLDGRDILVDAGTATYTGDPAERGRFRSTAAHNTIRINELEINPFKDSDPFRLADRTCCHVVAWAPGDAADRLIAEHDGYVRMAVHVRREVIVEHASGRVTLRDEVTGSGRHPVEWRFLFAPEVEIAEEDGGWLARSGGVTVRVETASESDLALRWDKAVVSPSYGVRRPTKRLILSTDAVLPVSLDTIFTPQNAAGRAG